jgi:hypothetical protein
MKCNICDKKFTAPPHLLMHLMEKHHCRLASTPEERSHPLWPDRNAPDYYARVAAYMEEQYVAKLLSQ